MWFREDVERILSAVDAANLDVAENIPAREMELYRAGFQAAISAVGDAFGVTYRRPRLLQLPRLGGGREVRR